MYVEDDLPSREEMLNRLQETKTFDIIIIGGGITGAGIARDAMLRGLSVCLLEKDDFASGTSMQSSKLLHGGLRYLQNYEFGLVREAAQERKINLDLAPHLSRIYRFVLPIYKWSKANRLMIRLGLIMYDILGFPRSIGKHRNLGKKGMIKEFPFLQNEDLVGGAYYHDIRTNDSRLTLLNILSATSGHAIALNYAEVKKWARVNDGVQVQFIDKIKAESYTIHGKVVINATGPWSEITESLGGSFKGLTKLKRTRGSHITIAPRFDDFAVLIINDDQRPIFLIPWEEFTVVGTTDTEWNGTNEEVAATKEDVDYILDALNKLFPEDNFTYDDVYSSWAGLRPLVYQEGKDERRTSRNHTINNYGDFITITGGKLTTYRKMAEEVVNLALKNMGHNRRQFKPLTKSLPLYSAGYRSWPDFEKLTMNKLQGLGFDERTSAMLIHHYGNQVSKIIELVKEDRELMKQLVHGYPFIRAQVVYAVRYEYALHPIDVLRRRFQLAFVKGNGLEAIDVVTDLMGKELMWDTDKKKRMAEEYRQYVKQFMRGFLDETT